MYRLIFHNGRFKGRRIAVQQGDLLIGRDPSCQIDLADDDSVSRHHARIEQRKDGVWLRDLGSINPTTVNGQAADEVKLRPGDRIEIGHTQIEFQPVEALIHTSRRKRSRLQMATLAAVAFILMLEAFFILVLPSWHLSVDSDSETPNPPSAPPAPVETPPPPAAIAAPDPPPDAHAEPPAVEPAPADVEPLLRKQVDELKQAISGLREQVEALTTAAVVAATAAPDESARAAPDVPPPPERPAPADPLETRMRELLALAQAESRKGNWLAADQAIERLLILAPDNVPALVERARLYEKRGLLKEAGDVWARLLTLTAGTPLYNEAAAERLRLAREEALRAPARPQAAAPETAALPRRIRIQAVERERFPGTREFDEMRLARIVMRPRLAEGRIDADDVRVWVVFYDRVIGSDAVVPTGATAPDAPLRIESAWGAGEQKSVTATYIVPKNFRAEEEARLGQKRAYEGYRVQVWYKGELQDEDAQPRTLLKAPMPDMPPENSPLAAPRAPPARPPAPHAPVRR
jgi:tetratricopeptide (TPR) repeat protein